MLILEQRDRPRDCLRVCDGLQAMLCPNAAAQARQQSQGLRSLCGPRGTEDLLGPRHGADDALQWQHALSQELAHRPPVVQVVAGHGCERLKHRQSLPRRAWVLAPAALQAPAERLEAPRRVKLSGHLQPELAPQKHGNEWEHSRDCLRAGFLLVEILEGTADDGLQAARVFQPAQGGAVVKKQLQDNRCRGHRVGILHLEHGHKGLHGACVNHLSMEPLIGGSAPKLRDPVRHSGAVFQALGSVRETAAALLQRRGHGLWEGEGVGSGRFSTKLCGIQLYCTGDKGRGEPAEARVTAPTSAEGMSQMIQGLGSCISRQSGEPGRCSGCRWIRPTQGCSRLASAPTGSECPSTNECLW
mmetsp:Transcript_28450/g.67737  ORF Transcript_28450/g.67737 Transcript_28450/m.67737 type:complete len:358 (-) Transcript_28450:942-2015(-)